nr:MAG TPA: hypothetical protein [Bacteriophage sp.]
MVTRIRIEIQCKQGGFMTIASPHTLETKAKGLVAGGALF